MVRDEAEGKLFGKEDLTCFAKQMNGLRNTLLIFGKHAPDFGLLFCIWNRHNMHKKLRASTCLPDTCPLYSEVSARFDYSATAARAAAKCAIGTRNGEHEA